MGTSEFIDLTYLEPLRASIRRAADAGWSISDTGGLIQLKGPITGSPVEWELPEEFVPYLRLAQADATKRGHDFQLHLVNHQWEFFSLPDAQPDQLFDKEELPFAKKAWESVTSALADLDLSWNVRLDLKLYESEKDGHDVQVHWSMATIDAMFENKPLASLSRFLPGKGHRTFLSLQGQREELVFGAVSFTTFDALSQGRLVLRSAATRLPGETSDATGPANLLYVAGNMTDWSEVSESLTASVCVSIWTAVSSGHSDSTVDFFGYKHATFELPLEWAEPQIEGAHALYRWALGDKTPNRLLALRQIVSLYTDPPFDYVDDILASSETIYSGLQSATVAEVVRDTRDAEAHAQQAVRQTSQSAVDLTKSVGERVLAGLVAVGVAATANVTKILDTAVTTAILAFVTGYFALMLTLFLLIDWRAVGLPIKQLEAEIGRRGSYLSPSTVKAIAESPAVTGARNLVRVARIAIAVVYLCVVIALLVAIWLRTR